MAEDIEFGNIGPILDEALNGTTLPDTPPELSPKEKERHERWLKKREEQEALAKKRAEELAAVKEKRRAQEARERAVRMAEYLGERKTNYRRDVSRKTSYSETVNGMTREEREEARENEYNTWVSFADKLNVKDPTCCPDDQVKVALEKYVRDYDNSQRFLFSFGMAVRPTFLLSDKNDSKIKYRAWKRITEDTIILEFGSQVPWKRDRSGERYRDPSGVAKNYFSVKYYDKESGEIKNSLFMYEREEGEFKIMQNKLNDYFTNIIPESRKRFIDFKGFLDKKTRGSFYGRLDDDVNFAVSTFIREGGSSQDAKTIHLKTGANGVLFDPNGVYLLANMSHRRAGVINPQEAIANGAVGFYNSNEKIGFKVPGHMAVIELLDNKVTFVYGA